MRFLFGIGSKLFVWDSSITKVTMRLQGANDDDEEEEFEETPPQDPHSTVNAHMELSPQAVYGEARARRFGFHGR